MRVPFLDLHAQNGPLREETLAAIARVCDSQRFIMGPEIESLERELAVALGVEHAIAVSSGTDALLLALMTLGVGAGDEVVTTTYSFFATAAAVVRLGARPVLVDIDPLTFNIDPEKIREAIGAVVANSLFFSDREKGNREIAIDCSTVPEGARPDRERAVGLPPFAPRAGLEFGRIRPRRGA